MGKWVSVTGSRELVTGKWGLGIGKWCAYACLSSPFDFALFLENPEPDNAPAGNTIFKGISINRVSDES